MTKKEKDFESEKEPSKTELNEAFESNQFSDELIKNNEKQALKISYISMTGNVLLSVFKLLAGLIGLSYAMVADAIHSFSDVFTTIIVIVGVKISARKADKNHPYGHDRFECVAAMILAFILFDVGLLIGYSAVMKLVTGEYKTSEIPKTIALVAAVVSIAEQVVMFFLTRRVAKKINSGALKADAWHHLSDSLSSIGSFVGILGAMLGFPILDIIAGLVICLIILKVAVSVFLDAVSKLTDRAAPDETEDEIKKVASGIDGVKNIDLLRTRLFGNMMYIDIEIACDPELSLESAHQIAQNVHDEIEGKFSLIKHCEVHVNPFEESGGVADNANIFAEKQNEDVVKKDISVEEKVG